MFRDVTQGDLEAESNDDVAPSPTRHSAEAISVSFRQGCVRPPESGFLLGQEAADGGPADFKFAGDLGCADALA